MKKIVYLEKLRNAATFAVVLLHIAMTMNNNYTPTEIGLTNYIVFSNIWIGVKWAVPCFLMISGALLLNKKDITVDKIVKYILRMFFVLLSFGTVFAMMEIFFNKRTLTVKSVFLSIYYVLSGQSWDHLWYIYTLIALYIITIPLKVFIDNTEKKNIDIFVAVLVIGNFIIPSINSIFGLNIKNIMIITEFPTYYILGYWLSNLKIKLKNSAYFFGWGYLCSTIIMVAIESCGLKLNGASPAISLSTGNCIVLAQSICVFLFFRSFFESKNINRFDTVISKNSFAIYLVHPFFINFMYKLLKITPLSTNIFIGIPICFIFVFSFSLLSSYLVKLIPAIRNIV